MANRADPRWTMLFDFIVIFCIYYFIVDLALDPIMDWLSWHGPESLHDVWILQYIYAGLQEDKIALYRDISIATMLVLLIIREIRIRRARARARMTHR